MIEIKADGENVKINLEGSTRDGITESICLIATLVQSLAEDFNVNDILFAEELFEATKQFLQYEEKEKESTKKGWGAWVKIG